MLHNSKRRNFTNYVVGKSFFFFFCEKKKDSLCTSCETFGVITLIKHINTFGLLSNRINVSEVIVSAVNYVRPLGTSIFNSIGQFGRSQKSAKLESLMPLSGSSPVRFYVIHEFRDRVSWISRTAKLRARRYVQRCYKAPKWGRYEGRRIWRVPDVRLCT